MDKFNIKRIEGYTIMSNHHLRDKIYLMQLGDFCHLCYLCQQIGIIHLVDLSQLVKRVSLQLEV